MISEIDAPVSADRQYSQSLVTWSAMNTIRFGCRSAFGFGGLPRFTFLLLAVMMSPLESEIRDRRDRLQTVVFIEINHRAGH
jgi:hypothetical protein